jgi:hypothetical protein
MYYGPILLRVFHELNILKEPLGKPKFRITAQSIPHTVPWLITVDSRYVLDEESMLPASGIPENHLGRVPYSQGYTCQRDRTEFIATVYPETSRRHFFIPENKSGGSRQVLLFYNFNPNADYYLQCLKAQNIPKCVE